MNKTEVQFARMLAGFVNTAKMPQVLSQQRTNSELTALLNYTHCGRTVSQRTLTTPTTFLSLPMSFITGYASDIVPDLITGATGCLPDLLTAPVVFNYADNKADKGRIEGLVAIAVRTKFRPFVSLSSGVNGAQEVAESLKNWLRTFVGLAMYDTADSVDAFIAPTVLDYFERNCVDGFMPIPPIKWEKASTDLRMELAPLLAEKGAGAGTVGEIVVNIASEMKAQLALVVEVLFVQDPKACGGVDKWPGGSTGCGPDHIYSPSQTGGGLDEVRRIVTAKTPSWARQMLAKGQTMTPWTPVL